MFNDKILKSVAEAVKQVLATEKLHPNQQKLDVHEPEKNKLTSKDFEMLRKGKKADVKEANNPFDVKNYKSQLPTKPGEKAGFDSKKISTGTVYTRKPVKDTPMKKEEVEDLDEAVALSDAKTTAERLVKKTLAAHGISNPTSAKHHAKNASAIESTLSRAKKAFTPGHLANAHSPVSSNQAANRRSNQYHSMSSADKRAHATLQAGVVKHLQNHLNQHNTTFTNAAAKFASKNKTNEEVEQINELEFTIGDVENFMQTEEFEQLDELSKNLVHRYWGKAIRSHAATLEKDIDMGDEHQKIKRLMAKTNKGAALGSRNKNPIHTPEVQKHLKAASDAVAKMREPAQKEMAKREKGMKKAEVKLGFISGGKDRDGNKVVKATGKLTNKRMYGEEVEDLDEAKFDPRGVTQEEASQEEFNKEIKIAQDKSIGKSKAEVAKPAVQAVKQESVEQIDELKKSTLASYVKKASHDVAAKGAMTRQFANDSAAAKKDQNYFGAKKADDKANKMFDQSWKRRQNMGKAVDRLAKEEVEHIEERSLSTGEKAAMEKNVKGMKKNLAGFKERYGKDAKSVMYATATANAKKSD